MATTSRMAQLQKLLAADVNALPDREIPMEPVVDDNDDDVSGGVSLEDPQPVIGEDSKQTRVALPIRPAPPPAAQNTERRFVVVKGAASAYNPGAMRTPTASLPKAPSQLPATDLQRGDLVATHHHFTPIKALAKYPYSFCDYKARMQDIASAFFDQKKFWNREWDLFYVWDTDAVKPVILVREKQFQDLLTEINTHLQLNLTITNWQREESLVTRFPDHPDCRPRFLGRSSSEEEYNTMTYSIPDKTFRAAGEPTTGPPDSGTLEEFKQLMEDLWEVQKGKNRANKERKQQERLGRQKTMQDQFKRAQRYLGLLPREGTAPVYAKEAPRTLPAVDASLPAPFGCDQSVVFVCVDVESYERAHHKITEIGVATLDTRDLKGIAPGKDGEAWRKLVKARHFRIQENRHLVNHEFVQGHPDGFDFGESTFVKLQDAPQHVAACFHPPFGVHVSNTSAEEIAAMLRDMDFDKNGNLNSSAERKIVFLGHDTLGDVRYLQNLGYDPLKVENIIEAMDTETMFQVWQRELQPASLGKILYHFDIIAWKLHNAGNDAMYTVQAMLAIAVRDATMRGSAELEAKRNEDKAARMAAAQEDVTQRINEEVEGWNVHEAGDGGAPVPLKLKV